MDGSTVLHLEAVGATASQISNVKRLIQLDGTLLELVCLLLFFDLDADPGSPANVLSRLISSDKLALKVDRILPALAVIGSINVH